MALGEVRQRGGKVVSAWAAAGDLDPDAITSNTFTLEWPPRLRDPAEGSPRSTGPAGRPSSATARVKPWAWPPRPSWSTGSWPVVQ